MTGRKTAAILPWTVLAAKAIQTAMQTRKLHRTPRSMASKKGRLVLAVAVAMTTSAFWLKTPLKVTRRAMKRAPRKLPRKTSPQFFKSLTRPILPSKRAMSMRLLPVNSSLPATTTMARPAVKIQAPAILPPIMLPKVAPVAARAINMPAKMPRRIIFHHLRLAFCSAAAMVLSAISVGVRIVGVKLIFVDADMIPPCRTR